jgi:hypothetical protein
MLICICVKFRGSQHWILNNHERILNHTRPLDVTGYVTFRKGLISLYQFFSLVALRPNAGHGLLILEVSRSHTTH